MAIDKKRTVKYSSRKRQRRIRIVTVALVVLALFLVPVGRSYAAALTAPGNMSSFVRTVEWMRNNHMGLIVAGAEDIYYKINQPPSGGPTIQSLPSRSKASPTPSGLKNPKQAQYGPRNIQPVIHPALPHEGVWTPAGQALGGRYPILTTSLRPDPGHPSVVAGFAWIDISRASLTLVPGRTEPRSALPPGPGYVPFQDRRKLLATFNSGFKTEDGHGGFIARGQVYVPPKNGLGTIAIYRNGDVKVGSWGSEIKPSHKIVYLRQNLPLLVDQGKVTNMSKAPWPWVSDTVANNVPVWRSGIGIDAHGDLIYAAADGITEHDLTDLLRRAGAVRAMALDENTNWVDFFTYAAPGGTQSSKLLPSMHNHKNRYLVPDKRDFFMVTKK